ncbi:MAG: S41 family peptidase [Eubacteriales bacterium]
MEENNRITGALSRFFRAAGRWLRRNLTAIFCVVAAVAITFSITFLSCMELFNSRILQLEANGEGILKIARVKQYYDEYYVGGELDEEKMIDYALYGLVSGTGDKYGSYFNKEDFARYMNSNQGDLTGIGVNVIYKQDTNEMKVVRLYPDSPAEKAGILPGDLITGVDGETLADLGYYMLVERVMGEEGTQVTIDILRDGQPMQFTMERAKLEIQSVTHEMLDGNVGYLAISEFNNKTTEQFRLAMEDILAQEDLQGIVFDVRNNGGGDANVIWKVLDMLLPEGNIYKLVDKAGNEQTFDSDEAAMLDGQLPVTVLVNGNTASAAELFAAALQDYDYAEIVGETTFGKGTGLSVVDVGDGSGLAISTTLYYTPSGKNIEGVGVIPDYEVSLTEEQWNNFYELSREEDPQLQKALAVLRGEE